MRVALGCKPGIAISESVSSDSNSLRRHFGSPPLTARAVSRDVRRGEVDFAILAFWAPTRRKNKRKRNERFRGAVVSP
jgi:hypothetical protein